MKNNTAHTSLPPGVPWTLPASPQPGGTADVYLSAVAPDLELTVLPLCRATEFLQEKKAEMDRVTLKNEVLRKYFPRSYTPKQMEDTILRLLEQWQKKRQRSAER